MRRDWILAASLVILGARDARAVGLEGDEAATTRLGAGLAAGVDQVGGYAQDAYPFAEIYGHAETRVGRWLYLAAVGSYRQDINNYNHAVQSWRGQHAPAFALQTLIGYDGRRFHISMGPWAYGASRRRPDFRARVLPYGVLRVRFGQQSHWHGGLQVGDAAPFTASGGYSARFMMGAPAFGAHRGSAGIYTSIGEKVLGLTAMDEFRVAAATDWRFGGSFGTMISHPGHIELAAFFGFIW
ncbi:MAG: hypothetical protein SF187_30170 [Deltaproteobacteria bacterium]|nr:hypothetical protein [Deltaproteobacteria bacterium]